VCVDITFTPQRLKTWIGGENVGIKRVDCDFYGSFAATREVAGQAGSRYS